MVSELKNRKQSGYLVKARPVLQPTLTNQGMDDDHLLLVRNVVLTSQVIDQELTPGMPTAIDEVLKSHFIEDHVCSIIGSRTSMHKLLGHFADDKALFDHYWLLQPVICMDVSMSIECESEP
jgi:hypothetical protein